MNGDNVGLLMPHFCVLILHSDSISDVEHFQIATCFLFVSCLWLHRGQCTNVLSPHCSSVEPIGRYRTVRSWLSVQLC